MEVVEAGRLELNRVIRPGDMIAWGQACAEPLTLTEALVAQRTSLGGVRVFVASAFSSTLKPEHADSLTFIGLGGVGSHRRLTKAGVLDVMPCHVSQTESLIRRDRLRVDVAFVQVSPPNERGEYSLGLTSDYIRAAVDRARIVVAEINRQVPQVPCAQPLTAEDIDYCIETDRPLVELPPAPVGELERRISRHAQPFIPDRATLQVGIGAIPEAIMADLQHRRGLGIHSGMIGDSVATLMSCGAVTNAHKEIDPGITVTGALIGTRKLYDFVDRNPAVRMHPVSYTHDIRVVSRLSRFISLNSAIEVDLTGQVNAESIGANYIGAVGGQVDYVRAAMASPEGRSLIALPSTAQNGATSRIVAALSGPVTTARSDVDVVVTEHGAAELSGKILRQRMKAMIEIADPRHRESLERAAHNMLKAAS